MDAADNKKKKTLHTVDYVTWGFIKCGEAQKVIKNARQVTQQSEVTSEADTSESHFTNNENLLYNIVDDCAKILLSERSDVPDNNSIEMRKTSSKCKCKQSTKQAKRVLLKEKKS